MNQNELKQALSKLPLGNGRYSGLGSDANINWVLTHDYKVLMKGYDGKRAIAVAHRISTRNEYEIGKE